MTKNNNTKSTDKRILFVRIPESIALKVHTQSFREQITKQAIVIDALKLYYEQRNPPALAHVPEV